MGLRGVGGFMIPKCPTCKHPLEEVREEYRSVSTYKYSPDNNKYGEVNAEERLVLICPYCGNVLPDEIAEKIVPKLPASINI